MTSKLLISEETTTAEAITLALVDAGVDTVFGLPGGWTLQLFSALHDHRNAIRTVLVREEARAGVMAEVYSRLTGRPAVCMGQGAFMTHASIGLIEALQSSTPMLLFAELSDSSPFEFNGSQASGTGAYGSWDAKAVFGGLTKEVFVPHTAGEAVQAVQLAVKHATSGAPGPVAVLFHSRVFRTRMHPETRPRIWSVRDRVTTPTSPPVEQVERAAQVLLASKRPVIVAGNGVRIGKASAELRTFAHSVGAPVTTTAGGKGTFAETDDLSLGLMGNFGTPLANAVLAEADVVVVVGSRLAPSDTALHSSQLLDPASQTLIHIDVEPKNMNIGIPADVTIVGDAAVSLQRLIDRIDQSTDDTLHASLEERHAHLADRKSELGHFSNPELSSSAEPILPQRAIRELQAAVDANAIVCCDAGENRLFMMHYYQTKAANTFIQSSGVGSMGYAVPAALAARLAFPDRQIVAVCGDGGFSITINALMTSIEEDLPIVVMILNNQALGWVHHSLGQKAIASKFGDFDLGGIARAFGCQGAVVTRVDDLALVLREALDSKSTFVVDVHVSLDESFETVTSPLMSHRTDNPVGKK